MSGGERQRKATNNTTQPRPPEGKPKTKPRETQSKEEKQRKQRKTKTGKTQYSKKTCHVSGKQATKDVTHPEGNKQQKT